MNFLLPKTNSPAGVAYPRLSPFMTGASGSVRAN